jgi:hypothetical protein
LKHNAYYLLSLVFCATGALTQGLHGIGVGEKNETGGIFFLIGGSLSAIEFVYLISKGLYGWICGTDRTQYEEIVPVASEDV